VQCWDDMTTGLYDHIGDRCFNSTQTSLLLLILLQIVCNLKDTTIISFLDYHNNADDINR
jgi:hypothetical protein